MRNKLLVSCILLLFLMPGCNSTSSDRIAVLESAVGTVTLVVGELDNRIQNINSVVETTQLAFADPNLTSDQVGKMQTFLIETKVLLAKFMDDKELVVSELQKLQVRLAEVKASGDVDIGDELQLLAATLSSVGAAVPGKPGLGITIAGIVTSLIAGAATGLKKGKSAGAAAERVHTAEIVRGLDDAIKKDGVLNKQEFIDAMNAAQSASTRAVVDKIQRKA